MVQDLKFDRGAKCAYSQCLASLTRCESLDIYSRPICCCCYYLFGCVFNKLLMYHHHHHQCRFLCMRFITSKYCNKRAIVMFEINAYWFSVIPINLVKMDSFHEFWCIFMKKIVTLTLIVLVKSESVVYLSAKVDPHSKRWRSVYPPIPCFHGLPSMVSLHHGENSGWSNTNRIQYPLWLVVL